MPALGAFSPVAVGLDADYDAEQPPVRASYLGTQAPPAPAFLPSQAELTQNVIPAG